MIHYTYKRDGGHLLSAASSSREAAFDYLRSVFQPGEMLCIWWSADHTGSAFVQQWTVTPKGKLPVYPVEELAVDQLGESKTDMLMLMLRANMA